MEDYGHNNCGPGSMLVHHGSVPSVADGSGLIASRPGPFGAWIGAGEPIYAAAVAEVSITSMSLSSPFYVSLQPS